jgi:hypothetical protein
MEFKRYWEQCMDEDETVGKEKRDEKYRNWEILSDGFMNNLPVFEHALL